MKRINLQLIIHDVRSCHNVGSILRSAEGLGVKKIYFSGYTPYPKLEDDPRLPHVADRADRQIAKTALDAQRNLKLQLVDDINSAIKSLKSSGYLVAALEQNQRAIDISNFQPPDKLALIVGHEKDGLSSDVLDVCDHVLQIPMAGRKESFNVSVATAIAIYEMTRDKKML